VALSLSNGRGISPVLVDFQFGRFLARLGMTNLPVMGLFKLKIL
jgi:hypothetical protein